MADFIPRSDAEAIAHGKNLTNYTTNNSSALNLNVDDDKPLKDALAAFETKYNAAVTKKAQSEAAIVEKDEARETYETELRKFNSDMHNAGDEHRAAMGLTVKDDIKTPIGAPTSHPVGERDEFSPDSKAKPEGAIGAQIWLKIGGAPPVDHKECEYISTDSRTPYNCPFDGSDAGKTAYYLLRWVNGKGETGPWSPLIQATITG